MAEKRKAGRPKNSLNKGNERLRMALSKFVERNYETLNESMLEVRATSPKDYVNLFLKIVEFSLPKLQSIQQTIEVGDDTISKISIEVVNNNNATGSQGNTSI